MPANRPEIALRGHVVAGLLDADGHFEIAGGVQAREQRRQMQSERVLDAVRRCAASLGRLPGPSEYARWRFHNDPDAPTPATAYRLFPGGWSKLQTRVSG